LCARIIGEIRQATIRDYAYRYVTCPHAQAQHGFQPASDARACDTLPPYIRHRTAAMSTRICLVRHGETAWNADRRLQGHTDIPLNDTGFAQARATAASLAGERFDAAYSSDLTRARQTADAIAARCGLTPALDPALRERHYGGFQALTYNEARTRFPGDYQRFESRDPDFVFPEGGESLRNFASRIRTTLERIAGSHQGGTVLVVTHGGVLDIAHRLATGKPLDAARDFTIPNAALNWISHDGETWSLIAWAEQRHLTNSLDELPNS
jgi:2,3-bisphosphoglycerate-dependent phosphoglycerate mutase